MLRNGPLPRILFVDDETAILSAIKRLFRREPYEIETASDGAAGLEAFRRFRPSVVVSDHRMPGMTGVEFLTRARAIDSETVRVILTGCTDLPAAEAAINEGEVWRFVTKPWNDEDLKATVAAAAEKHRLVCENRILLDKLASIGLLAGGVAHELNNPLGGILAYTELMQKQFASQPDLARDLKMIEDAAQRAKRIVRDLLDFARTSKGNARGRNSAAEICEKAISLAHFQIKKGDIEIERAFGEGVPAIFVDANRLEQVILNLLSNAIHAILKSEKKHGRIVVSTRKVGDRCTIEVADNGPGIPEDAIGKVFDPFFTTKVAGEGTGLGLSVSQGIVRDHGGQITVSSSAAGATFTVTFPAMPEDLESDANTQNTQPMGDAR